MGEFFTWQNLFAAGGPTLIILIICSIVSLVVIIERLIYFSSRRANPAVMVETITKGLRDGKSSAEVAASMPSAATPTGYVLAECLQAREHASDDVLYEEIKSRAIAETIPEMERYLNIEATLGTVAPFIGLLGTVLGIVRAFQSLGKGAAAAGEAAAGQAAGLTQLNTGIAEALVATAAGLFVAIPATIAYNYFRRRVADQVRDMEVAASRLKVALRVEKMGA